MPKEPTLSELAETVADLTEQSLAALTAGGEDSREYKNVAYTLRIAERRLASAKDDEKRKQDLSELSPTEIVDRATRW